MILWINNNNNNVIINDNYQQDQQVDTRGIYHQYIWGESPRYPWQRSQ